jgi:hypothetical protein
MNKMMSPASRREMLLSIEAAYNNARKPDNAKILDGFVAATSYDRKDAIQLLTYKVVVSIDIREKLLKISPATVDRLLLLWLN